MTSADEEFDVFVAQVQPQLVRALAALSPKQAEAIWLVHAAGMTHGEAGDAMGITATTVANHLERGMARLRDELGVDS